MSEPERGEILFVCAGNTCRSPLAEVTAQRLLDELGYPFVARSAGVSAQDDAKASAHSLVVATKNGLDLGRHKARLLTRPMVLEAALVLTMEEGQRSFIRVLAPEVEDRVHVLRSHATRGADGRPVHDPIGGDYEEYRRTFLEIRELVEQSLKRLAEDSESRRT